MSNSARDYDVIVIGSGFGGSCCAGVLANRGRRVLLIEKNRIPGGKAMSLEKRGHRFTPWVTIGAPVLNSAYQRVIDELDLSSWVELAPTTSQDVFYKGKSGRFSKMPVMDPGQFDPNVLFEFLEVPFEARAPALTFFMRMMTLSEEEIASLEGRNLHDWLLEQEVPKPLYAFLVALCCDGMFVIPVDQLDAGEAVWCLQRIFAGGGGAFCKGGFGSLAEALCKGVERDGGEVLLGTKVRKIVVEGGRAVGVETDKGTFHAPALVSNAGIQPTVLRLVGEEHFSSDYTEYVRGLVPSEGFIGYRYFLSEPATDAPYGVVFHEGSPWSTDRFAAALQGRASKEGVVYFEVPANYDPGAAPPGEQMLMTGAVGPSNPDLPAETYREWADAAERVLFEAMPEVRDKVVSKDLYTPRGVSRATRDSAFEGVGGETIGLAQSTTQCGSRKPSPVSPLPGLLYVGCDAGGRGIGTQQALDSGFNVAALLLGS